MDDSIVPLDLQRLIVGDHPLLFSVEIVVRTVIVYAYGLLLLRWLGSRTIGQLSTVEFLLVIALGSAVGDAMFYPDVPLLHALIVVTVVVFANKGLDILIAKSKRAERIIDGKPEELIVDGVLGAHFRRHDSMGISEMFQQLRRRGIEHLGEVRYAYAEPDGEVTVYRRRKEKPGLPIVPPWDLHPPPVVLAGSIPSMPELLACMRCGTLQEPEPGVPVSACPLCRHEKWTAAVVDLGDDDSGEPKKPSRRRSAASGRPK